MRFYLYLFIFSLSLSANAQELFPMNEAASTVPKGVLGVRTFAEMYPEAQQTGGTTDRLMYALRVMYGITSKLSVALTASESNHHDTELPTNLVTHRFINGIHYYTYSQNITSGSYYPYSFDGFDLFAKYRFLSIDGQNTHFRMAAYAEGSNVNTAYPHTEPNLMYDTKGYGGGLIITYLKKRFAVSLTSGVIIPGSYQESVAETPGSSVLTTTKLQYGNAVRYDLSFGYLLFPRKYKDYNQVNWNIYTEFMGKAYDSAKVYQNGKVLTIKSEGLGAGNYVDIYPGIQAIIKSNLRIDFSVDFPLISRSYAYSYPVYWIGIQRYFFRN